MFTINNTGLFLLYAVIIYGFIVLSRQSKDISKSLLVIFIIANIISLDYISINFSTHFIEIGIFEVVVAFVSLVLLEILSGLASMNNKIMLFIMELVGSAGLCYFFFIANNYLISLL